jgi:hypothetical protein
MADNGEIGKVWSLRRPRVYYAINILTRVGYARATGTTASRPGPDKTVLRITPSGRRALEEWLATPVVHVRDARSQLLLKLTGHGLANSFGAEVGGSGLAYSFGAKVVDNGPTQSSRARACTAVNAIVCVHHSGSAQ